jgi:hypothetical protein
MAAALLGGIPPAPSADLASVLLRLNRFRKTPAWV